MIDPENSHLSDDRLLLYFDGELSPQDEERAREHLKACGRCSSRCGELEEASAGFASLQQDSYAELPPADRARAMLQAQLGQLSAVTPRRQAGWFQWAGALALGAATLALGVFLAKPLFNHRIFGHEGYARARSAPVVAMPISSLTPGATLFLDRAAVCAQPNPNNREVPVAMQRLVFAQYGIPRGDTHDYEIDYLVTPALGGADDIHNLWPHSYSATVWNAKVKDALETRLRERVCSGSLDLETAQREIAGNWIAAYKKYFQTETPLVEHEK
jgi:hypothetical protein